MAIEDDSVIVVGPDGTLTHGVAGDDTQLFGGGTLAERPPVGEGEGDMYVVMEVGQVPYMSIWSEGAWADMAAPVPTPILSNWGGLMVNNAGQILYVEN